MTKYRIGLVATVLAVLCFSFIRPKSEGPCDKSVFWFKITIGAALESCGAVTSITDFDHLYTADSATDNICRPLINEDFVCASIQNTLKPNYIL